MKLVYLSFAFLTFFIFISACNNKSSSKMDNQSQNFDTLSNNNLKFIDHKESFDDFIYHFCFDENFRIDRSKDLKAFNNQFYFNPDYKAYLLSTNDIQFDNANILMTNEISYSIFSKHDSLFTEFIFSFKDSLWFLSNINKSNLNSFNPSKFISFLSDFCKDSIFQMHHTQFPLKTTFLDYQNDYSDTTVYLEPEDYITTDFFVNDTLSLIYSKFEFTSVNNITIIFLGLDNGIRIEYYFRLIDNKWKLIGVKDLST